MTMRFSFSRGHAEPQRQVAGVSAGGEQRRVTRIVPARVGQFVEIGTRGERNGPAIIEGRQREIRQGQRQRAVEHALEAGVVEIEVAVPRGFGERPESFDGEEVITAGPLAPHAVVAHAAQDLLAEARLRIVNRSLYKPRVVEQVADQADRGVDPALNVVNAVTAGKDDLLERGPEQPLLRGAALLGVEHVPDQVRALRHVDQPRSFAERLRSDPAAAPRPALVVVAGVAEILRGVGQQNFPRLLRVARLARDLINHAGIAQQRGIAAVNLAHGVAVEVERRLGGIAAQDMVADRTAMLPLPRPEPLALPEPSAVDRANVVVAPVAAARGEGHRLGELLVHAGLVFSPLAGPRALSDALPESLDVGFVQQQPRAGRQGFAVRNREDREGASRVRRQRQREEK